MVPCCVRPAGVVGIIDAPLPASSGVIDFARPKSRSFAPPDVSMMFEGFKSRWTIPA